MCGKVDHFKNEKKGYYGKDNEPCWSAYDSMNNLVAKGKNKNECMREARKNGFIISANTPIVA